MLKKSKVKAKAPKAKAKALKNVKSKVVKKTVGKKRLLTDRQAEQMVRLKMKGEIPHKKLASQFGISLPSFYNYAKRYG